MAIGRIPRTHRHTVDESHIVFTALFKFDGAFRSRFGEYLARKETRKADGGGERGRGSFDFLTPTAFASDNNSTTTGARAWKTMGGHAGEGTLTRIYRRVNDAKTQPVPKVKLPSTHRVHARARAFLPRRTNDEPAVHVMKRLFVR